MSGRLPVGGAPTPYLTIKEKTMIKPTDEQLSVVRHPTGMHARVVAVPGSGKTTTAVHRIVYLLEHGVQPERICVLQFNKRAQLDFRDKLNRTGVSGAARVQVSTFHGFALKVINWSCRKMGFPPKRIWTDEQIAYYINAAIDLLVQEGLLSETEAEVIDREQVASAIGLWKASMIVPENAGYRGDPNIELVYQKFEDLRRAQNALTFGDFAPRVAYMLDRWEDIRRKWANFEHLVVDEFQDANLAQLRMVRLLAGDHADILALGDPDQTLYEWRGARPQYLVRDFTSLFDSKPCVDYQLTESFRFGPAIGRAASNLIRHNKDRIAKPLITHHTDRHSEVHIIESLESDVAIAEQIVRLIKDGVAPQQVQILARTYAQLTGLEVELLRRRVPFRVLGREPFFNRKESKILLNYTRLAMVMEDVVTKKAEGLLISVANTPSRGLPRNSLRRMMETARSNRQTLKQALLEVPPNALPPSQREQLADLAAVLEAIGENISHLKASDLLSWLVDTIDYFQHLEAYYGDGPESLNRKQNIASLTAYAEDTGLPPAEFVAHINELDTTRGVPENELITMSTAYRAKGLEFDHVLVPRCQEGLMPLLREDEALTFDKSGVVADPKRSNSVEAERRLFFVTVTRARRRLYIGVPPTKVGCSSPQPSRFIAEMEVAPDTGRAGTLPARSSLVPPTRTPSVMQPQLIATS
jgi:DNA helicase-2/ATP-dependent DNA helicase PcrA